MSLLSASHLPESIRTFDYDRENVTPGIVHFGIGNFHRAHQAVYCDDLLASGANQWGITGVSLRSSSMQEDLAPQDYLYTLAVLGETTDYRIIGSIQNVLVGPSNRQAVTDLISNPSTQLVSSTITEKGYYLSSGGVDFDHAALQAELTSLDAPVTIYGFIAAGIIQRSEASGPHAKLTVMCCDNISAGGELLETGVHQLLKTHRLDALTWCQNNVAFVSSMVDRVCPATDDALRAAVLRDTGRHDRRPVSAEPFCQWIIEDNFAGERPAFETVGAVFVDDIAPFEQMKLRYLNAAHTIISTIGHLTGDGFVHETLERPDVFKFTLQALTENILPNSAVPEGYDGGAYIEDVIKRFQNSNLPYANMQVGTDSSQKIQQRWFPTIDQAISKGGNTDYFEFCLGAWVVFIKTALENDVLNDPKDSDFRDANSNILNDALRSFLVIANAEQFNFFSDENFMMSVRQHAATIKAKGVNQALRGFLSTQS